MNRQKTPQEQQRLRHQFRVKSTTHGTAAAGIFVSVVELKCNPLGVSLIPPFGVVILLGLFGSELNLSSCGICKLD